MQLKNRGENLSKEDLLEISENFVISDHASKMIKKRDKKLNLKKLLEKPFAAYFNTDFSINIAKDIFNYAVFVWDEFCKNFKMVTWKETSWYGVSVLDKQELAKKGISRKN